VVPDDHRNGQGRTETTFVALYRIVVVGIWQTLDGFLTGIWAFGVGRLAWQTGARPIALPLFVVGACVHPLSCPHHGINPGS
jgi:hypothetical protein